MKNGWMLLALAMIGAALITRQGKQLVQTVAGKKDLNLKHFSASEFGLFWPLISNRLLVKLDDFREGWGAPVQVSPAAGAIGRRVEEGGTGFLSQHNILNWGEVRAIDVMPQGMITVADRRRAADLAELVGFTGIGIYPDWKPRPGLHLDVRDGSKASWSAFKVDGQQQYFALSRALTGG